MGKKSRAKTVHFFLSVQCRDFNLCFYHLQDRLLVHAAFCSSEGEHILAAGASTFSCMNVEKKPDLAHIKV